MADQKISQLTELTSPSGSDVLPIVNNSETKKITLTNLLSGSNIQPYFISTETGTTENFKVGNAAWLGDDTSLDTVVVKGIFNTGSGYIKFGVGNNNPKIGHDFAEGANLLLVNANTTKFDNSIIVGSGSLVAGNPEMIHVYSSGSYNIVYLVGESEIYSQINVKNIASGETSSTDLVLTADNGNENELYINLGINSSNYSEVQNVGTQNDGYLIMNGQDLFIGSMNGGENHGHIHLFASSSYNDPQINILSNKQVGFNTSGITSGYTYEFSGSAKFNNDVKIDNLLKLNPVNELPIGSSLGDIVVSGSNLYFHNGSGWNSINITSV